MKVEEAEDGEELAVHALMSACIGDWAPSPGHLHEIYLSRNAKIFVVRGRRLLGFAMAGPMSSPGALTGTIYSLGVQDRHRRRGLGSALLAVAEGWLAGIGARAIRIRVPNAKPGVLTFFEKWGYALEEVAVGFYGPGRDGLLLVRSLGCDRLPGRSRSVWTQGSPEGGTNSHV